MKTVMKRYLIIATATIAIATSCNKSFLDQTPYNALPVDNAIKTEAEMQAGVTGRINGTDVDGDVFFNVCVREHGSQRGICRVHK